MTIELAGKVTNEKGTDLEGLTVQLYTATKWENGSGAESSDTTDSAGKWNFDAVAVEVYIVVVNNADSTKKLLFDGRNEVQFTEVDIVTRLQVDRIDAHTAGGGTGVGATATDGATFDITPGAITRTAATAVGNALNVPADTDNFDNASSTVAIYATVALGIQTLTGDTATLTFTHAASLYISGIPVASTRTAFSNAAYALWIDAGNFRLDSAIIMTNGGANSVTLPSATDTLMGKATTDVMTNKTYDASGTGNVLTNVGASEIEIGIITGHTALAAGPAETDEVLISDGGVFKRIDVVELLNPENFTAVTLPAAADELFINDGGVGKKITHDDLLFGANGTPSTQLHGDSAAIGTALDAARADHKHAMPGGAQIATGSYTGDGATSQTSPSIGFQPKYVRISIRLTGDTLLVGQGEEVWTTDVIVDDTANGAAVAFHASSPYRAVMTNMIIALDADDFKVDDAGANNAPNKADVVYNYLAIG